MLQQGAHTRGAQGTARTQIPSKPCPPGVSDPAKRQGGGSQGDIFRRRLNVFSSLSQSKRMAQGSAHVGTHMERPQGAPRADEEHPQGARPRGARDEVRPTRTGPRKRPRRTYEVRRQGPAQGTPEARTRCADKDRPRRNAHKDSLPRGTGSGPNPFKVTPRQVSGRQKDKASRESRRGDFGQPPNVFSSLFPQTKVPQGEAPKERTRTQSPQKPCPPIEITAMND